MLVIVLKSKVDKNCGDFNADQPACSLERRMGELWGEPPSFISCEARDMGELLGELLGEPPFSSCA